MCHSGGPSGRRRRPWRCGSLRVGKRTQVLCLIRWDRPGSRQCRPGCATSAAAAAGSTCPHGAPTIGCARRAGARRLPARRRASPTVPATAAMPAADTCAFVRSKLSRITGSSGAAANVAAGGGRGRGRRPKVGGTARRGKPEAGCPVCQATIRAAQTQPQACPPVSRVGVLRPGSRAAAWKPPRRSPSTATKCDSQARWKLRMWGAARLSNRSRQALPSESAESCGGLPPLWLQLHPAVLAAAWPPAGGAACTPPLSSVLM